MLLSTIIPSRQTVFFSISLPATVQEESRQPEYTLAPLTVDVLEHDPLFSVKERKQKGFARLQEGHKAWAFYDLDGNVAYYMWISMALHKPVLVPWELQMQFIIPPRAGYVWDCFTTPEHRRRGLYKSGLAAAVSLWRDHELHCGYVCARAANTPSLTGIQSAGFKRIFATSLRRIGPLMYIRKEGKIPVLTRSETVYDIIQA